jgi:hypothetical protein
MPTITHILKMISITKSNTITSNIMPRVLVPKIIKNNSMNYRSLYNPCIKIYTTHIYNLIAYVKPCILCWTSMKYI